jgi:hypothetical protein
MPDGRPKAAAVYHRAAFVSRLRSGTALRGTHLRSAARYANSLAAGSLARRESPCALERRAGLPPAQGPARERSAARFRRGRLLGGLGRLAGRRHRAALVGVLAPLGAPRVEAWVAHALPALRAGPGHIVTPELHGRAAVRARMLHHVLGFPEPQVLARTSEYSHSRLLASRLHIILPGQRRRGQRLVSGGSGLGLRWKIVDPRRHAPYTNHLAGPERLDGARAGLPRAAGFLESSERGHGRCTR